MQRLIGLQMAYMLVCPAEAEVFRHLFAKAQKTGQPYRMQAAILNTDAKEVELIILTIERHLYKEVLITARPFIKN